MTIGNDDIALMMGYQQQTLAILSRELQKQIFDLQNEIRGLKLDMYNLKVEIYKQRIR